MTQKNTIKEIDQRIERINQRLDSYNERFNKINERLFVLENPPKYNCKDIVIYKDNVYTVAGHKGVRDHYKRDVRESDLGGYIMEWVYYLKPKDSETLIEAFEGDIIINNKQS